jgi:hypothetical protein
MSEVTAPKSLPGSLLQDKRFLLVVGILILATATWKGAVAWFHICLHREAVPWPAQVQVTEAADDSFRNVSLPKKISPYELVEAKGKDDKIGGERIITPDMLEVLGMGTSLDQANVAKRISNWYVSRTYQDTREPMSSLCKFWRLDVTFYTGGLDTVPHIPEVCGAAAGMDPGASQTVLVPAPKDGPPAWRGGPEGQLSWRRVLLSNSRDMQQYMVFYIFSLNGQPENDRETVRVKLMDPWLKHCYFAKIEISPRAPVSDADFMERKAREFIQACLPVILRELPTSEDVQKLRLAAP